ncbi:hypothetical protein C2845_PM05G05180 [Panicum miliaceum]|uniref:Uncharacterized protein n=1 Tax=Panicum miliaceum TaxID=4540 RepID=A0A3L6T020_PANMI|nr:hypothetical protein C2845_PM05G05180 [Panicum miliaceum]
MQYFGGLCCHVWGCNREKFNASNVIVQSSNKLSILLLCDGIETVPAKQQVHFSTQKNIEEAVVYKLSYIPKASYKHQGCLIQCAAANSCFRGGQLGIVDRQYDGVDIFYHNCCAGTDITSGSAVLNGRREIVGLNLVYSTGWTMALHLSAIKDAIVEIFPDIQDKTFAGIQEYLKAKGEVEANKANN